MKLVAIFLFFFLIYEFSPKKKFSSNKLHMYNEGRLQFKRNTEQFAVLAASLTLKKVFFSNPDCGPVIPWFLSVYPKQTGTPP